jgi:polyribonucleotide nucleotidyltransferase
MNEKKQWSMEVGGRTLSIETGELAKQSNGSVRVQYGDTVVLATATMGKGPSPVSGYFPLMVDYEERFYASGKIKGSRFVKREGRPTDEAVLSGRLVDRTIRPLFDSKMRNDVQVIVTVLSYDGENAPDTLAIIAASAALHISDIPWAGPVAAVRVGLDGERYTLNPTREVRDAGVLDMVVSGTIDRINMTEAGAKEIPEAKIVEGFRFAHQEIATIAKWLDGIRGEVGKEKATPTLLSWDESFEKGVCEILEAERYEEALFSQSEKAEKYTKLSDVREKVLAFVQEYLEKGEGQGSKEAALEIIDSVADALVHKNILVDSRRPDGRALDQLRAISCRAGVLPRTHGSGLFTRGETQALTVATLGGPGMEQILDSMEENDTKKRYMHHYNFPPYSVGEVRPMRGPGRREIGHGALAERAILPLLPPKESFPYTIRVVSEILESNGSSSMASVCGSTLSLMDAGVPISAPASGIAMGIIIDTEDTSNSPRYKVLSDIQGLEDHFGDMDFKAAGTKRGITALQMDVKVSGVTVEMLEAVLAQSNTSRMEILEYITGEISVPRSEMSPYAPRIIIIKINPDKIRDVIGPGGKVINEIIDETGVEIDIEDDGNVFITSVDAQSAEKARKWVENLTREVRVGETFNAKITRIMAFGAFAEVLPGQEGLIHISKMSDQRVEKVEDVVNVGDIVPVKVVEIDNLGRINLSMKDVA